MRTEVGVGSGSAQRPHWLEGLAGPCSAVPLATETLTPRGVRSAVRAANQEQLMRSAVLGFIPETKAAGPAEWDHRPGPGASLYSNGRMADWPRTGHAAMRRRQRVYSQNNNSVFISSHEHRIGSKGRGGHFRWLCGVQVTQERASNVTWKLWQPVYGEDAASSEHPEGRQPRSLHAAVPCVLAYPGLMPPASARRVVKLVSGHIPLHCW